jgi:hypothetical protein
MPNARPNPAIRPGQHVLFADKLCITLEPIRNKLRMLDEVRRVTDDAKEVAPDRTASSPHDRR